MTFLRVFTFMGYGRALRGSLLLGGLTYYFMPDFLPGKVDDMFFIGSPLVIILLRVYIRRRKKRKRYLKHKMYLYLRGRLKDFRAGESEGHAIVTIWCRAPGASIWA